VNIKVETKYDLTAMVRIHSTTVVLVSISFICSIFITFRYKQFRSLNKKNPETVRMNHENNVISILTDRPETLCNHRSSLKKHQKVLSYTLYGDGTRESTGQGKKYRDYVRNVIKQASDSEFYKDWKVRIYHDDMIDSEILIEHAQNEQVDFCRVENLRFYEFDKMITVHGKYWRNIAMGDDNVDILCFRDLDSGLMKREEYAVQHWIDQRKTVHSMRDSSQHLVTLMAGMWCFRNELNRQLGKYLLQEIIYRSFHYIRKTDDQPLLHTVVWTKLFKDSIQHDSYTCQRYPGSIPFPKQREDNTSFVGCPAIPCLGKLNPCPEECRPKENMDWIYC